MPRCSASSRCASSSVLEPGVAEMKRMGKPAGSPPSRTVSVRSSGVVTDRIGRLYAEAGLQPERVADREPLPVVVEVRVDVAALVPPANALGPLVELAVGVVAA